MKFASTLISFAAERVLVAGNLMLTTVLVGRNFSTTEAATYFFSAAVAQVFLSPWTSGAESLWLGSPLGQHTPRSLHILALKWSSSAAVVGVGVVYLYISKISGPLWFGVLAMTVQLLYTSILRLVDVRFNQPGRYTSIMLAVNALAAAAKICVLMKLVDGPFTLSAVFSELVIASAVCLMLRSREEEGGRRSVADSTQYLPLVIAIAATLLSQKVIIWVAGLRLSPEEFANFGIAYAITGAAGIFAQTLSATMSSLFKRHPEHASSLLSYGLVTALLAVALGIGAFMVAGDALMAQLFGSRGPSAFAVLKMQFPLVPALLMSGLAWSVAIFKGRTSTYAILLLVGSLISSVLFYFAPATVATWLWSISQFVWCGVLMGAAHKLTLSNG